MKKIVSLMITLIIIVSATVVSFAAANGHTHSYKNHREKASVSVSTKPIGGSWYVGVELWNSSGRFPDYDDISSGVFTTFSLNTHSADTGSYSGATRGFYATLAKDIDNTPIPNTYGSGYDS